MVNLACLRDHAPHFIILFQSNCRFLALFFVSVKFLILSSLSVLMKVTVVCSVSISMKDLIVDSLLKDGDFTPKSYTRLGVCFFSI